MKQALAAICLCSYSIVAYADAADDLSDYVGYTISAIKRIAGYIDESGKKGDDFEGCEFGRKIVFDDGTGLTCSNYHYHYAFNPRAVIMFKSMTIGAQSFAQVVMLVGGDAYNMQAIAAR